MNAKVASLVVVSFLCAPDLPRAEVGDPLPTLDGSKWTIKVVPDAESAEKGEKEFEDELVFAGGKVTMAACVSYGFEASVYRVEIKDGAPRWKTEQVSEREGTARWIGKVDGDSVTGKLRWTKKDGTELKYTFAGKKR